MESPGGTLLSAEPPPTAARRSAALLALLRLGGPLVALAVAAPTPPAALAALTRVGLDAPAPGDVTAPLVALVALLAWALAGWLVVAATAVAAARLPGVAGQVFAALAARAAPATLRRTVEVALGLTVTVGALAPTAAHAVAAGPVTPGPEAAAAEPTPLAPSLDWAAQPTRVAPQPEAAGPAPQRTTTPAPAQQVVVQAGDTLWGLAAQALHTSARPVTDARVAQAWPRWWAANRAVIGANPHLLHPGTALTRPGDAASAG
jgi:hypothetical protein